MYEYRVGVAAFLITVLIWTAVSGFRTATVDEPLLLLSCDTTPGASTRAGDADRAYGSVSPTVDAGVVVASPVAGSVTVCASEEMETLIAGSIAVLPEPAIASPAGRHRTTEGA